MGRRQSGEIAASQYLRLREQDFYSKLQHGDATLVVQAPLRDCDMPLWTVQRIALVPDSDLAVLSMALIDQQLRAEPPIRQARDLPSDRTAAQQPLVAVWRRPTTLPMPLSSRSI